MRGLHVTAGYCAGQTRMYTFLYPYMGIVSRDNVHNVNVTARVRRACIYPYMGIMYTHVTMYIHNVRVTARVMYMYMTKTITSVYGHCIDNLTNIYNLAYTYMSIHTIHNVNYSAWVYLHANADL